MGKGYRNHEEGNTGTALLCICVGGEHNQNLYLCSSCSLGRQISKTSLCSGATDHLKSIKLQVSECCLIFKILGLVFVVLKT